MAVLGLLRLLLPLLLILLLYSPVRCAPCCCSDGPDHFLKPSAATKRGGVESRPRAPAAVAAAAVC